ncbi:hypothetical protein [Actinophytocola sp. NPDC049390]|uniref:hypothetical protein n=1 Tax=Actinophytocola sp. NPDC049390 TaxID=3363894 RepID=UPI00378895DD
MSPQTRLAHSRRRARGRWRVPKLDGPDAERAVELHRRQLRLALAPLAFLFAGVAGLPLLFAVFPALDDIRVLGIPVSWLALAFLPYPALTLLAGWQLRRAEKAEDHP